MLWFKDHVTNREVTTPHFHNGFVAHSDNIRIFEHTPGVCAMVIRNNPFKVLRQLL